MGQAFKKFGWRRNDIVVTTKLYWGTAHARHAANNLGLSRKHIVEGLRASLARLQLDYVDIVYAHRPDRRTPMEETVRAFNHVLDRGWALYWGTSEWTADEVAEACGIAARLGLVAPIVEQPEYSLLKRDKVEGPAFRRLYSRFGLGLTTWSPLKYGLLSGKYNEHADAPPEGSRFAAPRGQSAWLDEKSDQWYGRDEWREAVARVRGLRPVAERLGVTQAQLALAWCVANEDVSAVITGASRPEQVVENVAALDVLDKLTPEVMKEIDEIVGGVPGAD
jgi:voltage-dependent potassium channel beta subunit